MRAVRDMWLMPEEPEEQEPAESLAAYGAPERADVSVQIQEQEDRPIVRHPALTVLDDEDDYYLNEIPTRLTP